MSSRSFAIHCSQCKEFILRYKKDGSGYLIRVYIKQILKPEYFKQYKHKKTKLEVPPLDCPKCKKRIGAPSIYEPGHRPAYRMIKGSFFKQD